MQLPGLDDIQSVPRSRRTGYDHVPPWEPAVLVDDRLDLTGEPDIDPDEIDIDAWAAENDDEP